MNESMGAELRADIIILNNIALELDMAGSKSGDAIRDVIKRLFPNPSPSGAVAMSETDLAKELLPCPFCGAQPLLDHATLVRDTYHWVRCVGQNCAVVPSGMQCLKQADAISAWNRRAALDRPTDAEREELAQFAEISRLQAALTAAHQERDAAIRRAEQAEANAAALREALISFWNDVEIVRAALESTSRSAQEAKQLNLSQMLYRYAANLKTHQKPATEVLIASPATSLAALEKRVMLECVQCSRITGCIQH